MFVFVVLFAHIGCCIFFAVRDLIFRTMNFYKRRFNLYLLAALLIAGLFSGCATDDKQKTGTKMGTLRVHVATHSNLPGRGQTVKVLRTNPVEVTISGDPILSEGSVLHASVIDTRGGGFAIKVKFDEDGTWILEQNSAANPGGHFVIFGQWPGSTGRWLAAPLIPGRIANGELSFTPDCSYAEATNLVTSVNYSAQKIHEGSLK